MDEAPGSMLARLFLMGFIVTLCERPGSASKRSYGRRACMPLFHCLLGMSDLMRSPCGRGPRDSLQNGHLVTSPLSPLYDLVMVYCVVPGASTTRTSLDVEVDCMRDTHRSAWRRCRLKDQVDRGLIGTFQGGGRPLPLAA